MEISVFIGNWEKIVEMVESSITDQTEGRNSFVMEASILNPSFDQDFSLFWG